MQKLYRFDLREAVTRMREGSLTAAALMRACLARCVEFEPKILAWQHIDHERAMALAEAADAARAGGKASGTLHGVPLGIKDIIDVAGMPTTMGSPIYAGNIARETARCVQKLEQAGAIIIGKTVATEFAYYTPGKTRNPWNAAHTPGGSSSGSAAAVACGMVPGALGTQTNGSVIRPAAFCGVVGFKPSYGAVSNHGTLDPWPTLDHTGVLVRSVADAAWLASIIAEPASPLAAEITPLPAAPHVAAVRTPVWHLAEPAQRQMFASNVSTLRAAGAQVEEIELPASFADAHQTLRTIMAYEGAQFFRDLQQRSRGRIGPELNALLDDGAAITEASYRAALDARSSLQREFAQFMSGIDAVISPPAPGEAPATLTQTGNPAFCSIWSLLGVPAVSIPVGLGPHGLPLGLQVAGAFRADDATLAAAAWCEARLPFRSAVSE